MLKWGLGRGRRSRSLGSFTPSPATDFVIVTHNTLTLTPRDINPFDPPEPIPVDRATLTLTRGIILEIETLAVTKGDLTLVGQDIVQADTSGNVVVDAGALTLTGQSITETEILPITRAQLTLSGRTINTPADVGGFTTPTNVTIGTQNFTLYGSRESHSFRLYASGVHRFEVQPGDRETQVFQDGTDVERSQMDGGNQPSWRYPPTFSPGPGSSNLNYLIVTQFQWTPRQNVPGGAIWSNIWEWHHVNNQQPLINRAPIRIGHQQVGSARPVFLYLANHSSRAAQLANPNGWTTTDIQVRSTPAIDVPILFEEHVRFHETDGIYRLYLDGVLAYERTGQMVGYCDTQHYPQYGWYRSSSGSTGQTGISEFTFPDSNKRFTQTALPGGGSTYRPIAQAYFNATSTMTTAEKDSINQFVLDLEAAGISLTGSSSGIWLCNATLADAARRDLLHPSLQATVNGTVTHTPGTGITGNGVMGSYWNTNSSFTTNDDTLFMLQGPTNGVGNIPPLGDINYQNALGRFDFFSQARIANSVGDLFPGNTGGNTGGFIGIVRTSATSATVYHDTSTGVSGTMTEAAVVSTNRLRFGQIGNDASTARVVVAGKLPALNATQMMALRTACLNFQTRQAVPFNLASIAEMVPYYYTQDGLATGAVASLPNAAPDTEAPGYFRGVTASQGTAGLQPSKVASGGGILFAGNGGDLLTFPYQNDTNRFCRWGLIIFKVHGTNGTNVEQCNIFTMNAQSGGGIAGDNTPRIYFSRANLTASVNLRISTPDTTDCWVECSGLVADGTTWNVLLWHRRNGKFYVRLNGGVDQVNATYSSIAWADPPTNGIGKIGHDGATHPEFWIDRIAVGQIELTQSLADKIHAWGMHSVGRGSSLHSSSPWRLTPPVEDVEDMAALYVHNSTAWNAWGSTNAVGLGKNGGTVSPKFDHKGQAAPSEAGFSKVFMDDFRADKIGASSNGSINDNIWFAPGWMSVIGDTTNATMPTKASAPGLYVVSGGELALNLISDGTNCQVSAIFSVNNMGQGRHWKKGIFKFRCKLPSYGTLAAVPDALFPCPGWGYMIDHLFHRTGPRMEMDFYEFEGIDPGFINGGSSHMHAGQWPGEGQAPPYFGGLTDGDNMYEYANLRLSTSFWGTQGAPQIDIYDGLYHNWCFRIDDDMVYMYVDGYEVCRVPTYPEFHHRRLYWIADHVQFGRSDRPAVPAGTHSMYIDSIEVWQKDTQLAEVPVPFTARPTITGTLTQGSTLTLTPNLPAGTDYHVWWYMSDGYPILGHNGATCVIPAAAAGKQIRANVWAVGAGTMSAMPEATTALTGTIS